MQSNVKLLKGTFIVYTFFNLILSCILLANPENPEYQCNTGYEKCGSTLSLSILFVVFDFFLFISIILIKFQHVKDLFATVVVFNVMKGLFGAMVLDMLWSLSCSDGSSVIGKSCGGLVSSFSSVVIFINLLSFICTILIVVVVHAGYYLYHKCIKNQKQQNYEELQENSSVYSNFDTV